MTKLVDGRIPARTVCPFRDRCSIVASGSCHHLGIDCESQFSCAAARAFDLMERPAANTRPIDELACTFSDGNKVVLSLSEHTFAGYLPCRLWSLSYLERVEGRYDDDLQVTQGEHYFNVCQTEFFREQDRTSAIAAFVVRYRSSHPMRATGLGGGVDDVAERVDHNVNDNPRATAAAFRQVYGAPIRWTNKKGDIVREFQTPFDGVVIMTNKPSAETKGHPILVEFRVN